MQLGTRWSVGQEPPAALPEAMLVAVRTVEEELADEGVDASTWRWTLTWLERRPIAELDDGTRIHLDPLGQAVTTPPHDEEP
ncbi:hypothetical protein DEI93_04110 [Curtobacterium sp. MCBD17_035]|uniref:hypothetical protein n=1 Tax=Curtobacterium sp. MCBD17_035 TaxID=2175673 RepID=UPI000DA8807C|nr:hypothetical protein [Curtobacterium sp. MCBD17_035]WIB68235.1 hypothetical protein DEI93_04110 [Curtobacterium sp. MCBD17_035]